MRSIAAKYGVPNNKPMEKQGFKSSVSSKLFLLCSAFLVTLAFSLSAAKPEPVELTAEGKKILASYNSMLANLKAEITKSAPAIDEKNKASFIMYHGRISKIPTRPNPAELKMAPPTYFAGYEPYANAQGNALIAAKKVFKEIDPFLKKKDLDAKLAKCALLSTAARSLVEFSQQGKEEKALIDALINDDKLIVEVMELGGAENNQYGKAMRIYKAIQKASENARNKDFYRLWALASGLEHPNGTHVPEGADPVKLMVESYLSYEKAFHDGELDPGFGTLPAWEMRFVFDRQRPLADAIWMRKMIRNYRPDHMKLDYRWRYCRITKSDVPYTSGLTGQRDKLGLGLGLSGMQKYFLEGGICGPRAFTGRNSTHAFGIPSLPAPQTGHAAMAHWTPDGWVTVFGAHWSNNKTKGNGLNFELQSRVRRLPEQYRQFLRAQWVGEAFGEEDLPLTKFGLGGGLWKSLAFYKKLAICEEFELKEGGTVGAEFAESNEPAISPNSDWTFESGTIEKEVNDFPQIELSEADKTITTDKNGVITIPVAACKAKQSNEKLRFMKSYDGSFVQAHYSLAGNRPELLKYEITVPKAGKYEVSSNIVSVTIDRKFLLRVNRRSMYNIDIPFSMGDWVDTKPVVIDFKEGKNKMQFTIKSPNKGLSIRSFTLKPVI